MSHENKANLFTREATKTGFQHVELMGDFITAFSGKNNIAEGLQSVRVPLFLSKCTWWSSGDMGRHEEYSKGYVGLQPQVEKLRLYGLCQDFDK